MAQTSRQLGYISSDLRLFTASWISVGGRAVAPGCSAGEEASGRRLAWARRKGSCLGLMLAESVTRLSFKDAVGSVGSTDECMNARRARCNFAQLVDSYKAVAHSHTPLLRSYSTEFSPAKKRVEREECGRRS